MIRSWSIGVLVVLAAVTVAAAGDGAVSYGDAFWEYWGDGRAELAGYDLEVPRYGQKRRGVAVTIFVTETFSDKLRVKADPGEHPASDEFPVMKLNLVEDFPTGIYDYNVMTSAFVALAGRVGRPAGVATKVSLGVQEWCGHAYQQVLFDSNRVRYQSHSYFDGEADQQGKLKYPSGGVSEDVLLIWARGLAWPGVGPGEQKRVPILRSLATVRLNHVPLAWGEVVLSRASETVEVTVPAGTFEARACTAAIEGGRTWTFYVEEAHPKRVLQWETSDGRSARLIGSDRLVYWKMNEQGFESALKKLGLTPRGNRKP